jgi:hypothetical protein
MTRTFITIDDTQLELLDDGFLVEPDEARLFASESKVVAVGTGIPEMEDVGEAITAIDDDLDIDELREAVTAMVDATTKTARRAEAAKVEAWITRLTAARGLLDEAFKKLARAEREVEINVEVLQ